MAVQPVAIINRVSTREQVDLVADLARAIWHQHFVAIIGQEQVDYMLDKFQSSEAIGSQIDAGYDYYTTAQHGRLNGYLALRPNQPPGKMMVSKLYVDIRARGRGVGAALLRFAQQHAMAQGSEALWLTVNRENRATIAWYQRRGFTITDEAKFDIGDGFYMDDYIMARRLG